MALKISHSHPTKLSAVIFAVFMEHPNVTDIRFSDDEPVRVRFAENSWDTVVGQDGQPFIAVRQQIYSLINLVYHQHEAPEVPMLDKNDNLIPTTSGAAKALPLDWPKALVKRSLNPSLTIEGRHDDHAMEIRVRLSIKRVGIGMKTSVMVRGIPEVEMTLDQLGLPPHVGLMTESRSGLVVLCGATGSGKSTTLAACLNTINQSRTAHIITIEDPVEFQHQSSKSFFTTREVGIDVASYAEGVRDALRDVPDVILIGEVRDSETMAAALRAGESGHLVFCSIHASNTLSAVQKMRSILPNEGDAGQLASNLIGVIAQSLINTTSGKHLVFEVLDCREPAVRTAIATTGERASAAMDDLKSKLRNEGLGKKCIPMSRRVKQLFDEEAITPQQAIGLLVDQEDHKPYLEAMRPSSSSPRRGASAPAR